MNLRDGYEESHRRGFVNLWPVAEDYRIVGDQVCPVVDGQLRPVGGNPYTGARAKYLPATRVDLPAALAAVTDEASVVDFAKRYGLLGYAHAGRVEEVIGTRVREAPFLPAADDDDEARPYGDPVAWVLGHAATVRLALDLLGRLDDEAALAAFLATLKTAPDTYSYRAAERGFLYPRTWQSAERDRPPRAMALHILENVLNPNLTGTTRALVAEHQDDGRLGFSSLFAPRNLADAVYWHLADATVGGWVRQCKNPDCGAWFIAVSGKVKFCPAPRGYYSEDVELDGRDPVSLCGNRFKQKTYRARAKAPARRTTTTRKTRRTRR
jgi:hypothetical protein